MRKRILQNVDSMFRHYVGYCLTLLAAGIVGASVFVFSERDDIGTAVQASAWVLAGVFIGTILCLFIMRFLKARFHPKVLAKLTETNDPTA